MITVAVTGGIGSGKSTVSAALAERGAIVLDSDRLARDVVAPGTPGLAAIAETFGAGMITADGGLDRAALAAVVFADPASRAALEGITHPLVRAAFLQAQRRAGADAVVVNDIPLLTTLAAAASFHLVVGVHADTELRVQRLIGRGLTEQDARARMATQLTDDQRAPLCDVLLANDGGSEDLVERVDDLWFQRLMPFEQNTRTGTRAGRSGPRLVDHRLSWAQDGARLAARVSHAVGGARVDHIGSTAIPGMAAKDVIDLQLTVPDLGVADRLRPLLTAAGYPGSSKFVQDAPHPDGTDPSRWQKLFHANADPGQSLNLHVRVMDSAGWRWALIFRDWLIAEPAVAAEYLGVKSSLAAVHAADPTGDGYAAAKEPWLAGAYPRGLAWARSVGWSPAVG